MLINDISSVCADSCDFEWSSSATPIVSSIDTSNLASIKITGSNFDATTKSNNQILIGDIPCEIISATANQIICSAGPNPIGIYSFKIHVINKGFATMNVNPTVQFDLTASSITPNYSGTGGGLYLNVTGIGFSSKSQVLIDNINCPIVFSSYSLLTCLIPTNVNKI